MQLLILKKSLFQIDMNNILVKNVVASTFGSIIFILRQYRNTTCKTEHPKNSINELI